MVVTAFKESSALSIKKKIIPREIDEAIEIFFIKRLKVKQRARNNGIKKKESWEKFA